MPPRKRKSSSTARRRAAAAVSPEFAAVLLAAADFDSAEEAVEVARKVVEETAEAPGPVVMVLDIAGTEDWGPRLAALLEPLGAAPFSGGIMVLPFSGGLLGGSPIQENPGVLHAAPNQPVCTYGVVSDEGNEEGGCARLRRGLFFVAEGTSPVGVFLFWAALTRAPRRQTDRARLLDACDAKIVDLLGEELFGEDPPSVDGFVVHGIYDLPGTRVASTRWAGDVEASALARGWGAPVWPQECPPFLPPDFMNFSRDYRARGVQGYPNRQGKDPPPHRRLRVTSPVGALLGLQEDPP